MERKIRWFEIKLLEMDITSNLLLFGRFLVSFCVHRLVCHPLSEQMEVKDKR